MMVFRRKRRRSCSIKWFALLLLLCSVNPFCSAGDTITYATPIRDDVRSETLVSAGGKFELGFFTPSSAESSGHDGRRYVGIWYHTLSPRTVVWVANREDPVVVNSTSSTNGVLAIRGGNLQVLDNTTGKAYWSTGLETPKSALNLTVKLMDSGNLVLSDGDGDNQLAVNSILWQSFDTPTDTFIPGMLMDKSLELTSWRDQEDPGIGNFTLKLDQEGDTDSQFIISRKSTPYWKSGEPGKFSYPEMKAYKLVSNSNSTLPFLPYDYIRLVMNFTGKLQLFTRDGYRDSQWNLFWSEPRDRCSVINACGNFGSCNTNNEPLVCKCLPGFKPQFLEKWDSGDFSGGCARQSRLCSKEDTFLDLKMMKFRNPETQINVHDETECRSKCFNSCHCQAFSYNESGKVGYQRGAALTSVCLIWSEDLSNLQEECDVCDRVLSIRIALSDLKGNVDPVEGNVDQPSKPVGGHLRRSLSPIALAILICVIFLALILSIYLWRRKTTKRQDQVSRAQFDSERRVKELVDTIEFKENDEKGIDVPFFNLQSILEATDNFSDANKLGRGGYGPVYKGTFTGGQEIAVKRLSRVSGQGLQEFKNEVLLIAQLQHRNLVRLKGYCIKGEEKILVYEYMPNKSLDSFIFDHTKSVFLSWEMRFNIILGIARGLLYLHQDSRLRIIHRDLKTGNILLDKEMNPKISDFGLARIMGGKETEASTNRVVGTYGYISPEYALSGIFSVKSDVFSFGVVLLEIISGKRNTGFYQSQQAMSLLGYAWRLWTENKVLDLMDKTLHESCSTSQFVKCVNVGLSCVEEDPSDRPSMPNVITMLESETAIPPTPKRPAFVIRRGNNSSSASSSTKPETHNEITASLEEGR